MIAFACLLAATLVLTMAPVVSRAQTVGSDLIAASVAGDLARVEQLIGANAPLDAQDAQGQTALLVAVMNNHADVARMLIMAGASVNVQAANMDTPWLLAGASGRTEIIRAMIPANPDLAIRNRFGGNALIPACESAHVETIEVLLSTKIDVNHVNDLGWTCLLEIVILGNGGPRHQQATRLVLAAGANPNLADKNEMTALAHARANGQTEVAKLIEGAGGRYVPARN